MMAKDTMTSPDDVMLWPDGTWCYRSNLWEMTHMSDDYVTIKDGTDEWQDFLLEKVVNK